MLAAALTALVAGLILAFGPAPGDAPAHLYRTMLVREGALVWDNLWYAGHYPLASYSLLYYLPAALVGNLPLVIVAAVASTAIFCSVATREWGAAAVWPCRAFGLLAAAPVFTGLYAYSLGFTAMLAALWAAQRSRTALTVVLAAITFGLSPLAFVFLCLVLAAHWVAQRRLSRRVLLVAAGLGAVAGLALATMLVFPSGGVYPFNPVDFGCILGTCAAGILVARRAPQARPLLAFFALWALVAIACFVLPTPVGDNVTRLRAFVFPLMLATAALVRFRRRTLCAVALAGALAYNVVPYLILIPYRLDARPATQRFWQPAVTWLEAHSSPDYRVEVVPTAAHWEAWWLPKAGLPLARGWYRQLDMADYPALFHGHLDAAVYDRWLRATAVRFVLLPATKLDPDGSPGEARLLRSGSTALRAVATTSTGTIFELPNPTGIVSGPAPATVSALGHSSLRGSVAAAGTYRVRLRWSPYWRASERGACIAKTADKMIDLRLPRAGRFSLSIPAGLDGVVDALIDKHPSAGRCAGGAVGAGGPAQRVPGRRSPAAASASST